MASGVSPSIIVISGTQGAGKTTVARLLASRLERGVHIEADALQKMIVTGREWPDSAKLTPDGAATGEAAVQLRLRLRNACLLARSFADAGFTAVIDDIIVGSRLDDRREELVGLSFAFVMLTPDTATVRAREIGRGTQLFEQWEWLDDEVRHKTDRIGLWLNTSNQSPDETVDEVMQRACTEGVVHAPDVELPATMSQ